MSNIMGGINFENWFHPREYVQIRFNPQCNTSIHLEIIKLVEVSLCVKTVPYPIWRSGYVLPLPSRPVRKDQNWETLQALSEKWSLFARSLRSS